MKNIKVAPQSIIGQVVAADFRTAGVFSRHKIDFCCRGDRTIHEACRESMLDEDVLLKELQEAVAGNEAADEDFNSLDLPDLIDHIVSRHHRYVEEALQEIRPYLDKIVAVHGAAHPELFEVREEFLEASGELARHMKKEELILFPFVRRLASLKVEKPAVWGELPFASVEDPIAVMEMEHSLEGQRFSRIRQLTNDYTPPEDACQTYRLSYALLKAFEEDLHQHIHLENNILFPKAIQIETLSHPLTHH